jgi:muramoyltetrapeptide carboxypeptidase LdcA involved in peptidoglycan recycling
MSARGFARAPRARRGDRAAVLSLSSRGPARFPEVFDLGLSRIRDFGLVPVEYATTRAASATPADRAADFHAAWQDTAISVILTSIGGRDQHEVVRHLDPVLIAAQPKLFLGYSDNTNLLHFLWRAGVVGLHGAVVMVEWARPGHMHEVTAESLRRALFDGGDHLVPESEHATDRDQCDWSDIATLTQPPMLDPATPRSWSGPAYVVEGPAWGGAIEIIDLHLRSGLVGPPESYAGAVLFFETSDQLPSDKYVRGVLTRMGERGLLAQFAAVLVGRPKAWTHERPTSLAERVKYAHKQRTTVRDVLDVYNPGAITVYDVDLGHTDPQVVIPHGGLTRVDAVSRTITVTY